MRTSTGRWLTLVGTLCVSAAVASACSDDDPASPGGGGDSGPPDQFVPDGSVNDTGADVKDAGTDVGRDTGPGTCGVAPDPDTAVKVRFVNLLMPVNSGAAVDQAPGYALRLNASYANSTVVSNFPVVPAGTGPVSVTPYAKIPAGDITFAAQENAAGPDGGAGFKVAATVQTFAPGARITIVAVGKPRVTGPTATRAKLLILDESKLSAPTCSQVGLRFLNADDATLTDSFMLGSSTTAAADVPKLAAGAETGVVAPLATGAMSVTASTPAYFGPTGQAPFSIPSGVLAAGRSYFVASVGETYRFSDDERTHGLLVIPVGDETPARFIKRDPLMFFFHASPPSTPSELEVHSGGARLAIGLKYAASPTYADLRPGGATLQFIQPASSSDAGAPRTVLDTQPTGALDPGGIYFTSLMGLANGTGEQQLRFKSWKLRPRPAFGILGTPSDPYSGPVVAFVQASPTASAVDVGYWSVNAGGGKGSTFTSPLTNIPYGGASALEGVKFPVTWDVQSWYGAQGTGNAGTNRASSGTQLGARWYTAVLVGDWNATDAERGAQLVVLDLSAPSTVLSVPLTHP
ncbi:hypothetical protein LVJ94_17680 [Pendulispora rubella]|uniref:DUF4397 domain-containing protein n=1 Tax=Pendulispora rubella TaxID=2741070 RepID=A0ABZ2LDP1_9BACT